MNRLNDITIGLRRAKLKQLLFFRRRWDDFKTIVYFLYTIILNIIFFVHKCSVFYGDLTKCNDFLSDILNKKFIF